MIWFVQVWVADLGIGNAVLVWDEDIVALAGFEGKVGAFLSSSVSAVAFLLKEEDVILELILVNKG